MLSTGLLSISLMLVASPAPVPAQPKIPKELLEKRLEAARNVFILNKRHYDQGQNRPTELLGWSERWLEAELAIVELPADRARALRDHLDRTREVERVAVGFAKLGTGRQSDADAATYYRIEAEIRLIKEGVTPRPTNGESDKPEK